jgi:hypothetical protein
VERLIEGLRRGEKPQDESPEDISDSALNRLSIKNFPELRHARVKLQVKAKDPKLDVFFRARITAMAGTLNLYLDPETSYTWREASLVVAKSQGHGISHARNIRTWIHRFLHYGKLPLHRYGCFHASILEDEDFSQGVQLHLLEVAKGGYVRAQDVVYYVGRPEVQEKLGKKSKISLRTAQRWLKKLSWRYGRKRNGMYIDGHEQEDVVKYQEVFVARWKEYEKRMVLYDGDGNVLSEPQGFEVAQGARFRLIPVTHDELTFYAEDRRKNYWHAPGQKSVPERKGDGESLMVWDFLTSEWGRLKDDEE